MPTQQAVSDDAGQMILLAGTVIKNYAFDGLLASDRECIHSRTSVARKLIACLPWLF